MPLLDVAAKFRRFIDSLSYDEVQNLSYLLRMIRGPDIEGAGDTLKPLTGIIRNVLGFARTYPSIGWYVPADDFADEAKKFVKFSKMRKYKGTHYEKHGQDALLALIDLGYLDDDLNPTKKVVETLVHRDF